MATGHLLDAHRPARRVPPTVTRHVREAVLVAAAAGLAVVVVVVARLSDLETAPHIAVALAVLAAVAALAVGVLAFLVSRVTYSGRAAWIGAAYTVYALVGVPATLLTSTFDLGKASTSSMRLTAHLMVVVLLLFCCRTALDPVLKGVALSVVGVSVPAAAGALALLDPTAALALTSWPPVRWTVCAGWVVAAGLIVYRGVRVQVVATVRIGIGTGVIALAHAYRVYSEPALPVDPAGLIFSSVRLIGLLVVLAGIAELARRSLRGVWEGQMATEEELLRARHRLNRRAERNHDLRNGVAGIAGAASMMDRDSTGAVSVEIAALRALLDDREPPSKSTGVVHPRGH